MIDILQKYQVLQVPNYKRIYKYSVSIFKQQIAR